MRQLCAKEYSPQSEYVDSLELSEPSHDRTTDERDVRCATKPQSEPTRDGVAKVCDHIEDQSDVSYANIPLQEPLRSRVRQFSDPAFLWAKRADSLTRDPYNYSNPSCRYAEGVIASSYGYPITRSYPLSPQSAEQNTTLRATAAGCFYDNHAATYENDRFAGTSSLSTAASSHYRNEVPTYVNDGAARIPSLSTSASSRYSRNEAPTYVNDGAAGIPSLSTSASSHYRNEIPTYMDDGAAGIPSLSPSASSHYRNNQISMYADADIATMSPPDHRVPTYIDDGVERTSCSSPTPYSANSNQVPTYPNAAVSTIPSSIPTAASTLHYDKVSTFLNTVWSSPYSNQFPTYSNAGTAKFPSPPSSSSEFCDESEASTNADVADTFFSPLASRSPGAQVLKQVNVAVAKPTVIHTWMETYNTKCKRSRQTYKSYQTVKLEKEFKCNKYVTKRRRLELSNELRLSQAQIKTWFQNRRMKSKKEEMEQSATGTEELEEGEDTTTLLNVPYDKNKSEGCESKMLPSNIPAGIEKSSDSTVHSWSMNSSLFTMPSQNDEYSQRNHSVPSQSGTSDCMNPLLSHSDYLSVPNSKYLPCIHSFPPKPGTADFFLANQLTLVTKLSVANKERKVSDQKVRSLRSTVRLRNIVAPVNRLLLFLFYTITLFSWKVRVIRTLISRSLIRMKNYSNNKTNAFTRVL